MLEIALEAGDLVLGDPGVHVARPPHREQQTAVEQQSQPGEDQADWNGMAVMRGGLFVRWPAISGRRS